jgi:hypothetical protein
VHSYLVGEAGVTVHNYMDDIMGSLSGEVRLVVNMMNGWLGNSDAKRALAQDAIDLNEAIDDSPYSLKSNGIKVGVKASATLITPLKGEKAGPGWAGSVTAYTNGDVSVTSAPGVGNVDGATFLFSPAATTYSHTTKTSIDSEGTMSSIPLKTTESTGMYIKGGSPVSVNFSTGSDWTDASQWKIGASVNVPIVGVSLTGSWTPAKTYDNIKNYWYSDDQQKHN